MSTKRLAASILLTGVLAAGAVACSDDADDSPSQSGRAPLEFGDAPEGSTDLGLCQAYELSTIKGIVGGTNTFRRLPPTAIGSEGQPGRGELCAWERREPNGDLRTLTVEGRTFEGDAAALDASFSALEEATALGEPIEGLGDAAIGATNEEVSLVYVRQGPYELRVVSRAGGALDPVPQEQLQILAAAGLDVLP